MKLTRRQVVLLGAWGMFTAFMVGMMLPHPVDDPPRAVPYTVQAGVPDTAINNCHYRTLDGAFLPDPECTPGRSNPTLLTAPSNTICSGDWTGRRPLAHPELGAQLRNAYGVGRRLVTIDALIPPQLGGAADDPYNFWPLPIEFADMKAATTTWLWGQVCTGKMALFEAQSRIATNWYDAWLQAGHPNTGGV